MQIRLFANSIAISYVDFSYNKIKEIDSSTFIGLRNLEVLNLSRNEITSLDENLFRDTVNLTTLDLSHSKLTFLEGHIFNNLFEMKYLNLSHNYLEYLPASNWNQLTALQLLDASDNKFNYLYLIIMFASAEPIKAQVLINSERIKGDFVNRIIYTSDSEIQTESPTNPTVTKAANTDADDSDAAKPLEFNLHGSISESHKETGEHIVVTTTFDSQKKSSRNYLV